MSPLRNITCACLPMNYLNRLAAVRSQRQIKALNLNGTIWLIWSGTITGIAELIYPIPGSELYERRAEHWFAFQRQLPCFDVPDLNNARPLAELLFPVPVVLPAVSSGNHEAVSLRLVPDSTPQTTTALLCKLTELAIWIDVVPTPMFESLQAIHNRDAILLVGRRLPVIEDAQRFWGHKVLVPLGYAYDPCFPETMLLNILDIPAAHWLLMHHDGLELVDQSLAQPLTRAGVRLALRESNNG